MRKVSSPFSAASVSYIEMLRERYLADPASVEPDWRVVLGVIEDLTDEKAPGGRANGQDAQAWRAEMLRQRGHLKAPLDPLLRVPTGETCDHLSSLYHGPLAVETAHIDDDLTRQTLIELYESGYGTPDEAARKRALSLLVGAEQFEAFLGKRHPTKKRFGAEGAEAIAPLLDTILREAAHRGIRCVRIGTMHRGRLSLLGTVLGKPLTELFAEFQGTYPFAGDTRVAADVPYHLSHAATLDYDGHAIEVALSPNPSHLEAIDPVIPGRVRALQDLAGATREALCVVLHTDASVVAQGVVAETLQLSGLSGYSVGGTIHLVINNQIGFTTEIREARSSRHCTAQWKAIDSAIFHVNADEVDATLRAGALGMAFRERCGRDAVIDLVCYRRNGHNEIDEPRFTQPQDYELIADHAPVSDLYAERLVRDGILAEDGLARLRRTRQAELRDAAETIREYRPDRSGYPAGLWGEDYSGHVAEPVETGISTDRIARILDAVSTCPEGFGIAPKVRKLIEKRRPGPDEGGVAWAVGEALAFGSLLTEGVAVRLSGQDVMRGAFSHRHFALVDTKSGARHISLNHIAADQARFDIVNSPLSENAVLGFEYGYSLERPDMLTLWEAQFGDFANCAQVVIDQFIASAEDKWRQPSGLVLLLPHGLEGQGPEHSSARIERFLALAACDNMRIAHPSTPANYFHLLRRQALSPVKKPLVIFSPKTLLRHPAALSPLDAFGMDRRFRPILASGVEESCERVLLCSGKLAYDLEKHRTENATPRTAILRLEQLYPLDRRALGALFARMPKARYAWVQEEPRNMGAWPGIAEPLDAIMAESGIAKGNLRFVGRPEATSPAGDFQQDHAGNQSRIVEAAFAI